MYCVTAEGGKMILNLKFDHQIKIVTKVVSVENELYILLRNGYVLKTFRLLRKLDQIFTENLCQ